MDCGYDLEDMLFGTADVSSMADDTLFEYSDDDILFLPDEDELTLWDSCDNRTLSPTANDELEANIDVDKADHIWAGSIERAPCRDRHWVIARIEAVFEKIIDGLLEESDALTITLLSRATLSRKRAKVADGDKRVPEPKQRHVSFPGASAQEAWNFTVLLRMLELIHESLLNNIVMTKRDIYYRHPDLFVKQSVVDRYVDDLACTFGITRSQLNVTAAAKGLVAGNFSLRRKQGHLIHVMNDKEGMLVPPMEEDDMYDLTAVRWILVIEKEATFRSLMSSTHWAALGSHGMILTAKGYPDIASRKFLRLIADLNPRIPLYALVDQDPDGIAILSTYKYGSYRLAHEGLASSDAPALSLPEIRWLGVRSHHINRNSVGDGDTDTSAMPRLQGRMKLTMRDRTKAAHMLEWDLCNEDGPEQCWRQELQTMLMLNVKAEMQILDELPGGLITWLSNELDHVGHGDQGSGVMMGNNCSDDGMLF